MKIFHTSFPVDDHFGKTRIVCWAWLRITRLNSSGLTWSEHTSSDSFSEMKNALAADPDPAAPVSQEVIRVFRLLQPPCQV